MISYIIIFLIKIFDNVLSTFKTILIQKNKGVLAGISVFVSNIIFYKLIDAVSTNGEIVMYIICLASGIGTYLALYISNKFSKDRLYVNIILSDDKSEMKKLRSYLINNKITNLTTDGYTKDFKKTLAITCYLDTKDKSKLLDKYIENSGIKFKRIIQKD